MVVTVECSVAEVLLAFRKNSLGATHPSVTGSCRLPKGPLWVLPVDISAEANPSENSRLAGQGARRLPDDGRVSPVDHSENSTAPTFQTTEPTDHKDYFSSPSRNTWLDRSSWLCWLAGRHRLDWLHKGNASLRNCETTEESRLWTFKKFSTNAGKRLAVSW